MAFRLSRKSKSFSVLASSLLSWHRLSVYSNTPSAFPYSADIAASVNSPPAISYETGPL